MTTMFQLAVAFILPIISAISCPENYRLENGMCINIGNTREKTLFKLSESCFKSSKGRLIDANSIPKLASSSRSLVALVSSHRLFEEHQTLSSTPFYQNTRKSSAITDWCRNEPTVAAETCLIWNNFCFYDTYCDNEDIFTKAVCIYDGYYEKLQKISLFKSPDFPDGANHAIFNYNYDKLIKELNVQNKFLCLVECKKVEYCMSVYYSPASNKCIMQLYIDAPLPQRLSKYNDFVRYRKN